ncbi:MAG: hypothetical protein PWR31_606 [Bacillota bacterium]|nr:hypothetical protein [Bacillota bacterium]
MISSRTTINAVNSQRRGAHAYGKVHGQDQPVVGYIDAERLGEREKERAENDHSADGVDEGAHDEQDDVDDQKEHKAAMDKGQHHLRHRLRDLVDS